MMSGFGTIRRASPVAAAAFLLAAAGVGKEAAAPSPRVVVVRSSAHPSLGAALGALRASCACDPQVLELQGEEGVDARILGDALRARPEVVVALGSLATELVGYEATGVPFLSGLATVDPEDVPGGRGIRGVPDEAMEVDQIVKLGPRVRRVGVLYDPSSSRTPIERLERAIKKRGLSFSVAEVRDAPSLPRALGKLLGEVDAIVAMPDRSVVASREAISHLVLRCIEANVLLYTRSEALVKGGALCTLVVDPKEVGELLGKMVADVLRGEKRVADLAWLSPTFQLVVNLKTGRALGLPLPEDADASSDVVHLPLGSGSGPLAGFVPARVKKSAPVPRPPDAAPGAALVVLRARISERGTLVDAVVLSGEPPFTEAASAAVAGWSFTPATENGRPVASSLVLTVSFGEGR